MPNTSFLLTLVAIFVGAKLVGELAERLGQPAVLGELLAGVLLGSSVLGAVPSHDPTLHLLAQIGVIILLFGIGLETSLASMLKVGAESLAVAVVGVTLPLVLGVIVCRALGLTPLVSVVCGAALTATSVGITARVLADLGRLDSTEGRIVLGAAVIDDVIGLVILAIVGDLVSGRQLDATSIVRAAAIAFGFLALTVVVGRFLAQRFFALLERLGGDEILAPLALSLAFLLAVVAERAGSAAIVGAFAAGLVIEPVPQAAAIRRGLVGLGRFFVPIFFVLVGAAVDVRALASTGVWTIGGALLVVGAIGKLAAGWAPAWVRGGLRKDVIGIGMIPRGEVGLIFAQTGLAAGVLDATTFGALMLMVVGTTFAAPIFLRRRLRSRDARAPGEQGAVAEMTTEA